MYNGNHKSRNSRMPKWFKGKHKRADRYQPEELSGFFFCFFYCLIIALVFSFSSLHLRLLIMSHSQVLVINFLQMRMKMKVMTTWRRFSFGPWRRILALQAIMSWGKKYEFVKLNWIYKISNYVFSCLPLLYCNISMPEKF